MPILVVMASMVRRNKVIGSAFDGTGQRAPREPLGGEFLVRCRGFERVGQVQILPLPGGEAVIRKHGKTAVSSIVEVYGTGSERYWKTSD